MIHLHEFESQFRNAMQHSSLPTRISGANLFLLTAVLSNLQGLCACILCSMLCFAHISTHHPRSSPKRSTPAEFVQRQKTYIAVVIALHRNVTCIRWFGIVCLLYVEAWSQPLDSAFGGGSLSPVGILRDEDTLTCCPVRC